MPDALGPAPAPGAGDGIGGALDKPLAVTFFTDAAARTKREELYSLRSLATRINAITAARKTGLPWLKLARFGQLRTDKGSLRHDANVITISGIEADYDGGAMTVDEACELLNQQGLAAVVYTSPSHTEDAPRWRVLCPLSEEMAPDRREKMVGRLNGLFHGIFSGESFTLSQSFYYGSVNHNPSHRVKLIEGLAIDLNDDLDEGWTGRPATKPTGNGKVQRAGPLDADALLQDIMEGTNYHQAAVRLAGYFARHGMAFMEARQCLIDAMEAVPATERGRRWWQRRDDLDRVLEDIYGKEARKRDAQVRRSEVEAPDTSTYDAEWWLTRELEKPVPLLGEVIIDTTRALLGGPTGIGKTHLAMGMAAGIATGLGFVHWQAGHGGVPVLYLDGEMARDLIQERLADLKRRFGGSDLSNLIVVCREDFPEMEPLNTEVGQQFVADLVQVRGIRAVFFDNRMSLLSGDMKEEQPWADTMPLIRDLTRARVAQIWIDHTGHNTGQIYGTKTKEWQLDAVVLLSKADRPGTDIAFQLEFTKARRRRPETRKDFETVTLILNDDSWRIEGANIAPQKAGLTRMCEAFYTALGYAFAASKTAGQTTRAIWYAECVRSGLAEPIHPEDGATVNDRKQSKFRKYLGEIRAAGLIRVDSEKVFDLRSMASGPRAKARTVPT